jgi:hypothetical protein
MTGERVKEENKAPQSCVDYLYELALEILADYAGLCESIGDPKRLTEVDQYTERLNAWPLPKKAGQ